MGGCVCSSELPQTAWKEGLTDAEVILIMSILDPFQVFEKDHMDEFVLDAIEKIYDPTKIENVIKSSAAAKIIICKRLIDMNDLSTKSSLTQKKLDNFIISYLSNKELYEDVLLALIQLVSGGLLPMLELSPTKYLVPAYDEVKVSDFRGLKSLTDGSPYLNENENENIRIMMACMEKLDNCPQQWITLNKSLETQIEKGIINLKSLIALDKLEILKSLSMTFPVVRMPKLNMNYLTMAHKAGDIGVVSALMMKMHLEEIPIDLLESILLEDDNRDGIDKSLGSKVWEKISQRADEAYGGKGIHLLDGLDVMNACLKLVPVLRSGRGVNCALDIRSKTLPCDIDTKEIQMIWKKQKLIYVDPCTVDLRVCAPAKIDMSDIPKLVRAKSLEGELQLQAHISRIKGTKECIYCHGSGKHEVFQNMSPEEIETEFKELPLATSPEEVDAIKIEFTSALKEGRMQEVRKALHRCPALLIDTVQSRRSSIEAQWMYSEQWVTKAEEETKPEKLPYGGDMYAARAHGDRAAIMKIMNARKKVSVSPPPPTWKKFSRQMCQVIEECVNGDSTIVQVFFPDEHIHVEINLADMQMYDEIANRSRAIHREDILIESNKKTSDRCWVCKGAGQTSAWLENVFQNKPDAAPPTCLVCHEPEGGKYGMSLSCEHLFCEVCIKGSLQAILASGQFPAYCVQCRADAGGAKDLHKGEITRPVLSFLRERGIFSKSFQFRFVAAMRRVGAPSIEREEEAEIIECPAQCYTYLYSQEPEYTVVDGKSLIKLCSCPCGADFCISCKKVCKKAYELSSGIHECQKLSDNQRVRALREENAKSEQELMASWGKIGKACPVCKLFIEKNEGCTWMMCGETSHGNVKNALRNGGCGIAFKWDTMNVEDDPCGYIDVNGKNTKGRPITVRQLPNKGRDHPKCKREECSYYKCVDGMRANHHKKEPSNIGTGGGDFCCSGCKFGKPHTDFCHRVTFPKSAFTPEQLQKEMNKKASKDTKGAALIKYVLPFDAQYVRCVWQPESLCVPQGTHNFYFQVLGEDSRVIQLHDSRSQNMISFLNKVRQKESVGFALDNRSTLELDLGSSNRITGFRFANFHMLAFKLSYKIEKSLPWTDYSPLLAYDDRVSNHCIQQSVEPRLAEVRERLQSSEDLRAEVEIKLKKKEEFIKEDKQLNAKVKTAGAQEKLSKLEKFDENNEQKEQLKNKDLKEKFKHLEQEDAERFGLLQVIGDSGTQCPACGMIIERISGDDNIMCGCAARPAGGTTEKALLAGGCGHEFHFKTHAPLGTGKRRHPNNARQWKFTNEYLDYKEF